MCHLRIGGLWREAWDHRSGYKERASWGSTRIGVLGVEEDWPRTSAPGDPAATSEWTIILVHDDATAV